MESIKELRKICQKPIKSKDINIIHGLITRKLSIYVTKLCLLLGISANQVTLFFNFLMILSGILFMFGKYWYTLIGAIFLPIIEILDASDGEIARYNKTASINGKFLDAVLHHVIFPFFIFGLSFGVYQRLGDVYILVLGFIAGEFFLLVEGVSMTRFKIVFGLVYKSSKTKTQFREVKQEPREDSSKQSFIGKSFYYFNLLHIIVLFCTVLIAAIFDWVYVYLFLLIGYAVILPIITFGRIYYEYKKGLERFIPYLKVDKEYEIETK